MVRELQDLALSVFLFSAQRQFQLDLIWLPRRQNAHADFFSKVIDFDDYSVHDGVFKQLDYPWGPHSIDRFASSYKAKLSRFSSRFLHPGTEAVDAFTQDWSSENNWLVPSISLIAKLLSHMHESKAVGTLIVPIWKSSYFWPLVCSDGVHFNSFVADWLYLSARPNLFVKGRAKNTLFGSKAFKLSCVALRLDFAGNGRSVLQGFCTVPQEWCSVCRP